MGLRYRDDPATGTRFETLATEFGDGFMRVELEGKGHATLTAHRQQVAVDRVLAFFDERLPAGRSLGLARHTAGSTPCSSDPSSEPVIQAFDDDVLVITLNRPEKRNALSLSL